MTTASIYYLIFGFLTLVGGIIGFARKRSIPSLISGGTSGVLLFVAAYLLKAKHEEGLLIGLAVSLLLAGKFIPDFIHKKNIVLSSLMSTLSIVAVVLTLLAWYKT